MLNTRRLIICCSFRHTASLVSNSRRSSRLYHHPFDKIPHQRHFLKLRQIGIRIRGSVLGWIECFLTTRSQKEEVSISSGVLQVAVLASLLFLLFIDDTERNIDSEMRLFADDCLVHRVIKQDSDCLQLHEDISSLCHWEDTWKVTFYKTKCCVIHMIHEKNLCLSTYNMRGEPLVPANTLISI